MSMAMILDGAALLILLNYTIRAARGGLANTVVRLAGSLAAFAAAWVLSGPAAEAVYEGFLRRQVLSVLSAQLGGALDVAALEGQLAEAIGQLPGLLSNAVSALAGGQLHAFLGGLEGLSGEALWEAAARMVIDPAALALLRAVAFLTIYALSSFVVRALAGAFRWVNRIPLIGSINALLGGVLGALQGAIVVFLLCLLLSLLDMAGGGNWRLLDPAVLEHTYLVRHFVGGGFSSAALSAAFAAGNISGT